MHKEKKEEQDELHAWEVAAYGSDVKDKLKREGKGSSQQQSLLRNWPLMSSIIVYCVFQLHDMAYAEVISSLYLGLFGKLVQYTTYCVMSPLHSFHFFFFFSLKKEKRLPHDVL